MRKFMALGVAWAVVQFALAADDMNAWNGSGYWQSPNERIAVAADNMNAWNGGGYWKSPTMKIAISIGDSRLGDAELDALAVEIAKAIKNQLNTRKKSQERPKQQSPMGNPYRPVTNPNWR